VLVVTEKLYDFYGNNILYIIYTVYKQPLLKAGGTKSSFMAKSFDCFYLNLLGFMLANG
jgi:hypothetical protein